MTIPETFTDGLRPLQLVGALDIQATRRKLLADQPGAGKTAQALFALELDGLFDRSSAILILCNVTGCQLTWSPEIRNRVATQHEIVFADLTNAGQDKRGRDLKTMPSVAKRDDALADALMEAQDRDLPLVVLANFDLLNWKFGTPPKMATLFGIVFDAILIDESHLVLPTKKDHPKESTQFWSGLMQLPVSDDVLRISMSGTPDRGKLENRYGHWKFLYPHSHQDYWAWAKENFVVTYEEVGWNPVRQKPNVTMVIGKQRQPERWKQLDDMRMLRRTKAEMLVGLPEKQWANDGGIDLGMTPVQKNAYLDFEADTQAKIEEYLADDKADKASGLKLQWNLRSRQMAVCTWKYTTTVDEGGHEHTHGEPQVLGRAGSTKLAWILDQFMAPRGFLPEDYDAAGGKVVITSYFTQTLDWLKKELAIEGVEAEILSGDTPGSEKKRIEERFQRGDLRVILLSGWVGVSINLDAADEMIFLDSVHDPDKMEQAEDRIHRASRNHQVTYHRLAAVDTVDMAILMVVDHRYNETRKSYDGDRGVQFARKMLGGIPREEEAA